MDLFGEILDSVEPMHIIAGVVGAVALVVLVVLFIRDVLKRRNDVREASQRESIAETMVPPEISVGAAVAPKSEFFKKVVIEPEVAEVESSVPAEPAVDSGVLAAGEADEKHETAVEAPPKSAGPSFGAFKAYVPPDENQRSAW